MPEEPQPHPNGESAGAVTDGRRLAAWLAAEVLLLATPPDQDGPALDEGVDVSLHRNGGAATLQSGTFSYPLRDGGEDDARGSVLIVSLPPVLPADQHGDQRSAGRLVVRGGDTSFDVDLGRLVESGPDLGALVRRSLAPLDAATRNQLLDFLARSAMSYSGPGRATVAENLFQLRQALRERLPVYAHGPEEERGMALERITAVDASSYYMEGWLRDTRSEVLRLTAISPEGARVELAGRMFSYPRPDLDAFFSQPELEPEHQHGFICYVELDAPSLLNDGWVLESENARGQFLETGGVGVDRDAKAAREIILADPARDRFPHDELMENHVWPAMSRIQKRVEESSQVDTVEQFGTPPSAPDVSIIVPLYGRIDLLEQQLAEFADDMELQQSDIIYVLDSPEQDAYLLDLASRLYPIYRVPFRVAVMQRNAGFAGANNAGASLARGRLLLLMNSDVLPDRPGWIGRMREFYDETPAIGCLGVKLLYEDGSIQHAGMYFHQPIGSTLWLDAHYFKGLHRDFPAANVTRVVPGVSGACMMIDRELYEELGGLSGVYVQGDYEDFDLCFRLAEAGRDCWYLPEVELYHLEALSYAGALRLPANRYNVWLHTHLWRDRIEALMAELGEAPMNSHEATRS